MDTYKKLKELKTLKIAVNNQVAYLTFNRPDAMNTYNLAMSQELPDCLETIAEDSEIRVLVLNGAGHVFMAGGDVDFLAQASDSNQECTLSAIASLHESIIALRTMDKLVVAAVHGACAGAGLSIMLASDFAYAATDTKFNTAYIHLGLSPDGGLSYTLPRLIGEKRALELLLLSQPFYAADALRLGLINQMIPKETFTAEIDSIAQILAKKPALAVSHIKQLINASSGSTISEQLAMEQDGFFACTKSDDFKNGVATFLNKPESK